MKVQDVITELLKVVNGQKESFDETADWNMMNVVYTGDKLPGTSKTNIANNPRFSICGKDNVDRYNKLYNDLLHLLIKDKEISLKTFQDITQNLIFENDFTVGAIKELINSIKIHKTIEFFEIYGVSLKSNTFQKGRFTFVSKEYIDSFVFEQAKSIKKNSSNLFVLDLLAKAKESKYSFSFVAVENAAYDDTVTLEKATMDIKLLIDALMFMFGSQGSIISFSPINIKKTTKYQINVDDLYLNASGEMHYGGAPIVLEMVADRLPWHSKIWNIISKTEHNEIEKRIIKAIEWVSKAYAESDENIKRVEIAFAFEALLQSNTKEMIKESISALLSEQYAFINGSNLEDRKNKEKEFKDFYRERSGIAHGGKTHYETDVNKYFLMVISTIYHLLMDERFSKCKSGDEVYLVIKDMKYKTLD